MNRDRMRERLESFLELCEAYDKEYVRATDYSDALRVINDQMTFQMPTVREILKRLDPALAPGREGAPVPRRRLRLAESRPAGTRYPPRSGRVGSESCT